MELVRSLGFRCSLLMLMALLLAACGSSSNPAAANLEYTPAPTLTVGSPPPSWTATPFYYQPPPTWTMVPTDDPARNLPVVLPVGTETISLVPDTQQVDKWDYIQISLGGSHSCGLKRDGRAICWGDNYNGQLQVPDERLRQISAGFYHTCGLREDGQAICWGSNDYGQARAPDEPLSQVAAGTMHSCGLRADGSALCWGTNDYGESSPPEERFRQIEAGGYFSCGITLQQSLLCWGNPFDGETKAIEGRFVWLRLGLDLGCAIRIDQTALCWALNGYRSGELITGSFTQVVPLNRNIESCGLLLDGTISCSEPGLSHEIKPPGGHYVALDTGEHHSCAIHRDSSVVCWGDNEYGQADPPGSALLQISPQQLPEGFVGGEYDQQLIARGGLPPYSFEIVLGALPSGLSLDQSGRISGALPDSQDGSWFEVRATDSRGVSIEWPYYLGVSQEPAIPEPPERPVLADEPVSCALNLVGHTHTCDGLESISLIDPLDHGQAVIMLDLSQYRSARFEVTYGEAPHGYSLNIGDSASNNGWAGDSATQSNDAELMMADKGNLLFWASDYGGSGLLHKVEGFAQSGATLSFTISNGRVDYADVQGQRHTLESPYLFALAGQSDLEGQPNYTIYAAFNRVISDPSRSGSGVNDVLITLEP